MAYGTAVRDREKEAKWRRVVAGQRGSRLSIRAYCIRQGVKDTAFYWWRAELARRDAVQPGAAFVPVRVVAEDAARVAGGRIEIFLSGGRRVQVAGPVDRAALADVVAVLEGEGGGAC